MGSISARCLWRAGWWSLAFDRQQVADSLKHITRLGVHLNAEFLGDAHAGFEQHAAKREFIQIALWLYAFSLLMDKGSRTELVTGLPKRDSNSLATFWRHSSRRWSSFMR